MCSLLACEKGVLRVVNDGRLENIKFGDTTGNTRGIQELR